MADNLDWACGLECHLNVINCLSYCFQPILEISSKSTRCVFRIVVYGQPHPNPLKWQKFLDVHDDPFHSQQLFLASFRTYAECSIRNTALQVKLFDAMSCFRCIKEIFRMNIHISNVPQIVVYSLFDHWVAFIGNKNATTRYFLMCRCHGL